MQIVVQDIEAQVAWAGDAHESIYIRPVAVHQPPVLVHQLGDFLHVLIEEAQGVWIGQHHTHNTVAVLVAGRAPYSLCRDLRNGVLPLYLSNRFPVATTSRPSSEGYRSACSSLWRPP